MSFRKKRQKRNIAFFISDPEAKDSLIVPGYTSLDKNPEVMTAVRRIAELIGSITIHLMENTNQGDKRIINALSEKIDISPNAYMTRKTFIESVVMNLLLYGKGNSIVRVHTDNGYISDLEPIAASRVSLNPIGKFGYYVSIDGIPYDHNDVLHFVLNPDKDYPWKGQGIQVSLKEITNNLKQARATEKGFLESKWKPSLIVKVDAMDETFASKEGRKKLLDDYIEQSEAGAPWIIPAEQFSVEQVKPLSLADLALNDAVEIDKRTVASIVGVPPFLLGVGNYNKGEWNAFINSIVKTIVIGMQQELTRKLIVNPKWYYRFNVLSLLDWDIKTISEVFGSLSDRGFVTGNEVRDRLGMSPMDGLDELRVLENYIPYDMSAFQKKLVQNE